MIDLSEKKKVYNDRFNFLCQSTNFTLRDQLIWYLGIFFKNIFRDDNFFLKKYI